MNSVQISRRNRSVPATLPAEAGLYAAPSSAVASRSGGAQPSRRTRELLQPVPRLAPPHENTYKSIVYQPWAVASPVFSGAAWYTYSRMNITKNVMENSIQALNISPAIRSSLIKRFIFSYPGMAFFEEFLRVAQRSLEHHWSNAATEDFIKRATVNNRGDVLTWGVPELRDARNTLMSSRAPAAIGATTENFNHLTDGAFGLISTLCTLNWKLTTLTPWVFVGLAANIAAYYAASRRLKALDDLEFEADRNLQSVRSDFADNVLMGSKYNFEIWEDRLRQATQVYNEVCQRRRQQRAMLQVFGLLCNSISLTAPAVLEAHRLPVESNTDVLNLEKYSRQIVNLNFLAHREAGLIKDLIETPQVWATVNMAHREIESNGHTMWQERSDRLLLLLDEVSIIDRGSGVATSVDRLVDLIVRAADGRTPVGRFQIQANNGVGKTTFLLAIQNRLGPGRSALLPSLHRLAARTPAGSSGQTAWNRLQEIVDNADFDVLLCDEVTANMDAINRGQVEALLNETARRKLIIEVVFAQTDAAQITPA